MEENKKPIQVHLGCGKVDFGKDWIHIDKQNLPHITSNDIINLPFEQNSVDLIYASHVLEYFDRESAGEVLKKWFGYLKHGGVLRLAVPDFRELCQAYLEDDQPLWSILGPLYGRMYSNGDIIYHKTIFDYHELGLLLKTAGFRKVEKYNPYKCQPLLDNKPIDDCSFAAFNCNTISLNVEARKE